MKSTVTVSWNPTDAELDRLMMKIILSVPKGALEHLDHEPNTQQCVLAVFDQYKAMRRVLQSARQYFADGDPTGARVVIEDSLT